jgi:hypothetical protein
MSFIRTDQQAALNDLLVAIRETNDHYRDAVELVNQEAVGNELLGIARYRETFITRLEQAVRESGDLPAVPDPDREAGAMLIHHVTALLKDDVVTDVLEQRLEGEKNLANLIAEGQAVSLEKSHHELLDEISQHIARTIEQLQSIHKATAE